MNLPVNMLPRPRPDYFPLDTRKRHIGRVETLADEVGTSFLDCTDLVPAGQVLVIDRILATVVGRVNTGNEAVTLRLTDGTNNRDLPIAIPGLAAVSAWKRVIDLQPGNCFALGAATKLQIKVSHADVMIEPSIFGYFLSREEARTLGIEPVVWNGTAYTGNGFIAGSHVNGTAAFLLAPAKAGLSPQVEWIHVSGFANDATAQTLDLRFETAPSSGVFATLMRFFSKGTTLNDSDMHQANFLELNGPYGSEFQSILSAASTHSVIVGGRYVGRHNTCDPTGVHTGPIAGTGKKFWSFAEGTATGGAQVFATDPAAAAGNEAQMAHIRGVCFSQNITTAVAESAVTIARSAAATAAVGPTLSCKSTIAHSLLVNDIDVPMEVSAATTNVHIRAVVSTVGSFAGTVWGRLRPSSAITMQTSSGITPLDRIFKDIQA